MSVQQRENSPLPENENSTAKMNWLIYIQHLSVRDAYAAFLPVNVVVIVQWFNV